MKQKLLLKGILFSLLSVFLLSPVNAQTTTIFKRLSVIQPRAADPEGYGNLVVGNVIGGSGPDQIFAVSGELNLGGIIPRIYEFQYNSSTNTIDSVWASVPPLSDQNTWCPLTIADLDGDGKMEVVWGPINAGQTNPIRLLDYEAKVTDGSSPEMGLPNGAGGDSANASWTMTDSLNYNSRPFRWVTADLYNNGKQELVFCTRAGGYVFGVISVNNIPNSSGDTHAVWKMDTSGIGLNMAIGTSYKDVAVIDSTIYLINLSGDMQPVRYANGTFTVGKLYPGLLPGGDWKSAQVADLDGNGKAIIVASWSNPNIYLLQPAGDSLTVTQIASFASLGVTSHLGGSAMGDFNGDGHMDFAFGSRTGYSTPEAGIYVLYYNGGDITSSASYSTAIADSGLATGDQWDIVSSGKIDGNAATDEIVYSGIDRSGVPAPIGVLNSMNVDSLTTISEAVKDADNNYVPDDSGATVKVIGIINSGNDQGTNYCSYSFQDGSRGLKIFGNKSFGTNFKLGDRVLVKGVISQYNGLNEIAPTSVTLLDSMRTITPPKLTIESLMNNPEAYESVLIELDGVAKTKGSGAWPTSNANASMEVWDGHDSLAMFIDKDFHLDTAAAPVFPVNVQGVISQYTSSKPANSGYEIHPSWYSQFTQNVAVPPSPYFALVSPADSSVISITDSTSSWTAKWNRTIDLNGDAISYAFNILPSTVIPVSGGDTSFTITAATALQLMAGADTVTIKWTVLAKGKETTLSASVDTFTVTFINAIVTGIKQGGNVPTHFYVNQNYPNPFNPTTTISFGLPRSQNVDLRVYNILGQQVAVLINNETRSAGDYHVTFNAMNLASGTYIYTLRSGDKLYTKKMLLLK